MIQIFRLNESNHDEHIYWYWYALTVNVIIKMLCNIFASNQTLTICVDNFSTVSSLLWELYDYIDVVVDDDDNAKDDDNDDDDDNVILCSVQSMAMFKGLENMLHAMLTALWTSH